MNVKSTAGFPASITYGAVLGQVLARRRQAQMGLHQQDVAASLGIGQPAYSRLESGQSAMSVSQLRRVALRLGTQPSELLAEADRYVMYLQAQGVVVVDDKEGSTGELLIGLGILAALLASGR